MRVPLLLPVVGGPVGKERGVTFLDLLDDILGPFDVQVRFLLAGKGGIG